MKDKYAYYILSEIGTEKSFYASNDEEAEDIMFCDKRLPKDIQLDLNRRNDDGTYSHVTSTIRVSKTTTKK